MFDPRLLMRPWRSGAFRIQALALLVASLAIAAVVLMRGELDHRFANRTAEAIGGNLIRFLRGRSKGRRRFGRSA